MYYRLLFVLLMSAPVFGTAQPNLYRSNGISDLTPWPLHEVGNQVFYLCRSEDTVKGAGINNYFITAVDKHSYTIRRSLMLLSDTAFNIYESVQHFAVSYSYDPAARRFNFFFLTDIDSSLYAPSALKQYPKTISFMQLDTNLNVTVDRKDIVRFYGTDRYALRALTLSLPVPGNNTLLNYDVRDTIITERVTSSAAKLLLVNDTGAVLQNRFLGFEPVGDDTYFGTHFSNGDLYRCGDQSYVARVNIDDSISNGKPLLITLDSILALTDTFEFYTDHTSGVSLPGKELLSFGGLREHFIYLPTGSLISSAVGSFKDLTDHRVYHYYGIGKGDLSGRYRPAQIYFPPVSDTGDYLHSAAPAIIPAVYNAWDNRIYCFSATRSNTDGEYCLDGKPSLGQLAAIDTNLVEQWVKYVLPRPGHCIRSLSIAPADGRRGALVSGWETDLSDPHNRSLWHPFIYHIDSSSRLEADDPEGPVRIADPFTLYPNPAHDQLVIGHVPGTAYAYSVYNSLGQIVASGKGEGTKSSIDVSRLSPGIYNIRINTAAHRNYVLRFSKQ